MNILRHIVMALVVIGTSLNINAAPHKGGGIQIGAGIGSGTGTVSRIQLTSAPGEPVIEVFAALLPRPDSVFFQTAVIQAMTDIQNGNFVVLTNLPTTPAGYSLVPVGVNAPWYAHVYSQTTPMYAGVLNRPAPFDNEHGYTLMFFIRLTVPGGKANLSMITRLTFNSNDGGTGNGSLYEDLAPSNLAYSTTARGYNAGGPEITSGPGSQPADAVILPVWDNPFDGGGTQAGLNEVQVYVEGLPNFTRSLTVEAGGVTATRFVETKGGVPIASSLRIVANGSNYEVAVNDADGLLQSAPTLSGPWNVIRNVTAGTSYTVPGDANQQFFRVVR